MFDTFVPGNSISNNLLGVYQANPELLKERNEVAKLYRFYTGKAKHEEDKLFENTQGQSWAVDTELDYVPSQEIRNHTKKLLLKQRRFMFGAKPDITFKPLKKGNKDKAEEKRMVLEQILDDTDFWGKTSKAFLDATIGKRVLLTVQANPGEPMSFRYYPMDQFTYEVDSEDYSKLTQVIIAYLDAETANKPLGEQRWTRWKYYYGANNNAWIEYGVYNGFAEPVGAIANDDTLLDELPCRVIINGGLTGDITGESDVIELIDLQNAYNRKNSDYSDALKFRMFEQPVFTDADSDSLEKVTIAPNAMIDLKTDPTMENAKASAQMLSSSFNFKDAAEAYLDRAKTDMYELMDQPRPEQLQDVPSAKALKFMFYDLIARCEEKWLDWEPAVKWLVKFTVKCVTQFKLYPEYDAVSALNIPTNIIVKHNYPLPEDDEVKRDIAIKEVQGNVKSHKTYIREFGDVEDENGEWEEILTEQTEVMGATTDQFAQGAEDDLAGANGGAGAKGGTGGKEDDDAKKKKVKTGGAE